MARKSTKQAQTGLNEREVGQLLINFLNLCADKVMENVVSPEGELNLNSDQMHRLNSIVRGSCTQTCDLALQQVVKLYE